MKNKLKAILEKYLILSEKEIEVFDAYVDKLYQAIYLDCKLKLIEEELHCRYSNHIIKGWNSQHAFNTLPLVIVDNLLQFYSKEIFELNDLDLSDLRYEYLPTTSKKEPDDKDNKTPKRRIREILNYYSSSLPRKIFRDNNDLIKRFDSDTDDGFIEYVYFRKTKKHTDTIDFNFGYLDLLYFYLFYNHKFIPPYHIAYVNAISVGYDYNDKYIKSLIETSTNLNKFFYDRLQIINELKSNPKIVNKDMNEIFDYLNKIGNLILLKKVDRTYDIIFNKNFFDNPLTYNIKWVDENSLSKIRVLFQKSELLISKQMILELLYLKQFELNTTLVSNKRNKFDLLSSSSILYKDFIKEITGLFNEMYNNMKTLSYPLLLKSFYRDEYATLIDRTLDLSMFSKRYKSKDIINANRKVSPCTRYVSESIVKLVESLENNK